MYLKEKNKEKEKNNVGAPVAQGASNVGLNARHKKTLSAVFERPTRADIPFTSVEGLVKALGGFVEERAGSGVCFSVGKEKFHTHRPHGSTGGCLKREQARDLRRWLSSVGVKID